MAIVIVEDVADAIVAALAANAGEFPEPFTASVAYVKDKDYSEYTEEAEVCVFPRKEENKPEDRESDRFDLGVGIAIVRKVANSDYATVKPFMPLPRAIRDFLRQKDMAGCDYENTSIETLYGAEELKVNLLVTTIGSDYSIDQ